MEQRRTTSTLNENDSAARDERFLGAAAKRAKKEQLENGTSVEEEIFMRPQRSRDESSKERFENGTRGCVVAP